MITCKMGDILTEDPTPFSVFEAKGLFQNNFKKLSEFFREEILCDVEIRTGRKAIKCHRVVLACCSPYFRAMFTSSLSESRQKIINIGDIDEAAMEMFVKFAYTARVELSVANAQPLLHAASVLQLDALAQACCEFMKSQLHPSNCLGIRQFAERHGHMSLVRDADTFTELHFQQVVHSDEFLNIGANHLQHLISSSELCTESEMEVYEAMMRWVNHDIEKRKDLLPGLLSRVRLPLLLPSYLHTYVETDDLVRRNLECRDLLDEARYFQLCRADLLPGLQLPTSERTRPRKSYAGMLFCVGGRGRNGDPFASIECYSWFHNKWFKMADMSTRRRHVGCVAVGGKVYAVGGCDDKEHMASAEVYDPQTNKWTTLSSMLTPRRGLGLCCLGGPIYAVGGLDDNTFYSVVERYDISSDIWTTVASLNCSRGGVAVTVLKGHIYSLGGNNGPISLNSCEKYDPHLNKWTFLCRMNQSRAGAGATVLDGYLYCVGGFDNNIPLNSVERYDPETDSWSFAAPMGECRGGVGVAALGGRMYAVGGHNGHNYLTSVEVYDPLLNRWEQVADISECRAGAGVTWCPCSMDHLCKLGRLSSDSSGGHKT